MSDSESDRGRKSSKSHGHSSYGGSSHSSSKSKDEIFRERASKLDDDVRRLETKTFISKIPKIYFVAGAVPVIIFPTLYFVAPNFVRSGEIDEDGKCKFDTGKWLAWCLFFTTFIWFGLYVYYTRFMK